MGAMQAALRKQQGTGIRRKALGLLRCGGRLGKDEIQPLEYRADAPVAKALRQCPCTGRGDGRRTTSAILEDNGLVVIP
mgnify:CR=1 FL=1